MQIPKQLQKKCFRFIKIVSGQKKAAETDWTLTNNYKYNESEFQEYLKSAKAYGVVCGFGKLAVIDCDTKEVEQLCKEALPNTFEVRTGSGGCHLYYIIDDLDKQYKLYDAQDNHHGEVQFLGQQVLGPNSLHPSGNQYELAKDIAITKITRHQLLEVLSPYIKQEEVQFCTTECKLDMHQVASKIKGLTHKGKELVGAHPVHGSEGGENFHIDVEKGVWHCFRCQTGGDAFTLIAVLEGVLKCHECRPGALAGDKFKQVVAIAKKKYGYVDNPRQSTKLTAQQQLALSQPNLLYRIIQETRKEGVIGNEITQLAIIMKIALRFVKNATKTSSNLLVTDETGGGKDWVTTNVCNILLKPYDTLFKATGISEKVLNYWEPLGENSSWDGRVLYLEDPEEGTLTCQAFKVRASGNNEIVTLDTERKVMYKRINGKPIIIVTSLKQCIDVELMRRWDAINVDTSEPVTQAIQKYKLEKSAGLITYNPDNILRTALQELNIVEVVIPFAPQLASMLPNHLIMRSQISKLIDYIKASAALHQYNRDVDAQGRIIATLDDYAYAAYIFDKLGSIHGQALNKAESSLVSYLWEKDGPVKLTDISKDVPTLSQTWVYNHRDTLVERGVIRLFKEFCPANGHEVWHVEVNKDYKITYKLPKPSKLGTYKGYFNQQLWDDINIQRKADKLPPVRP